MTEEELFTMDYNLDAALRYNGHGGYIERIAKIVISLTDGADEASWCWIVQLNDGRFAYVSGGHDYTGWDCQSSCDWEDANTFEDALKLAPQCERRVLEDMLAKGEEHRIGYERSYEQVITTVAARHVVLIRPLNKWARERVKRHGEGAGWFLLHKEAGAKLLVESLGKTYRLGGRDQTWLGWFECGVDCEWL